MPKLYFRYGAMNSSKTANLLMVAHNYRSQGKSVILIKPKIDTRFGQDIIASRAIEGIKADLVIDENFSDFTPYIKTNCFLVDESQFLSEININALRDVTRYVPVICYGLRTDYRSKLFPGSKRLMEIADSIEEMKTTCISCDRKAIINAKTHLSFMGTEIVALTEGSPVIDLGAEDKYQPMCYFCWDDIRLTGSI